MSIRRCPHCRRVVSLHLGSYRCSWCHIWLKEEECPEVQSAPEKGADRALDIEPSEMTPLLIPSETSEEDKG